MKFLVLAVASATALATVSPALAQLPPLSDEFQVNTDTTLDQLAPDVGMDASGNFVVVWVSYQYGPSSDVYARRYDSNGNALGLNFLVNTYTTDRQILPAVAVAPTGEFLVTWQSFHQTGGSLIDVYAQRYDGSGNPAGGEFLVNTYTTSYQYGPAIAAGANGNFVVVWSSYMQDGDLGGVYGKVFDASGTPVSGEFQVNQYTTGYQSQAKVAYGGNGDFVVAWQSAGQDGDADAVMARRFGPDGTPRGNEFQVNVTTSGAQNEPAVAADAAGNFVVVWDNHRQFNDAGEDIFARRFGSDGAPRGDEFQVNTYTSNVQDAPRVAMDGKGNFVVTWQSDLQDGFGAGVAALRFDRTGQPVGSEFRPPIQSFNAQERPSVVAGANGRMVFCWDSNAADLDNAEVLARMTAPLPQFLQVDAQLALSETETPNGTALNGVLEPGETVIVVPGWLNNTPSPLPVDGVVSSFTGPPGATYTLVDNEADYGTIPSGEIRPCGASAGCYSVQVDDPAVRPATHWDATINEEIEPNGTKAWTLHVGESFGDVPDTHAFYKFVETLLHNDVTGGCSATDYCPDSSVTRAQMAVFLLKAKHGGSFVPPVCTGVFPDVPCPSLFADWIEQLAEEGITGGCAGGNYCPGDPVTRQQMAVFLLKAVHGSDYTPPACTGVFPDVACPSLFADWVERLAEEGITGGCGGGNFCPTNPNTRGQMAVFLTKTFSLALYGP